MAHVDKGVYSIVSMAILVNGSSTQEFFPQKGLRQGEPLSPFLFNVIVEALNILMERAMEEGLIRDIKVAEMEYWYPIFNLQMTPFSDTFS